MYDLWKQQKRADKRKVLTPLWSRAPPLHLLMNLWIIWSSRPEESSRFSAGTELQSPVRAELSLLQVKPGDGDDDDGDGALICVTVYDTQLRRLQSLAKNCHTTLTRIKLVRTLNHSFRFVLST